MMQCPNFIDLDFGGKVGDEVGGEVGGEVAGVPSPLHDDHGAHAVSASDGSVSEKADRGKYYFLYSAAEFSIRKNTI